MKYLLDTDICIGLLRSPVEPRSAARLKRERKRDIALCSVVKAELRYGAEASQRPQEQHAYLLAFFMKFRSFPFGDSDAAAYGRLRNWLSKQGTPIGANDLMIAAIALTNGLILVTHNTREFGRVPGLVVEDWQV